MCSEAIKREYAKCFRGVNGRFVVAENNVCDAVINFTLPVIHSNESEKKNLSGAVLFFYIFGSSIRASPFACSTHRLFHSSFRGVSCFFRPVLAEVQHERQHGCAPRFSRTANEHRPPPRRVASSRGFSPWFSTAAHPRKAALRRATPRTVFAFKTLSISVGVWCAQPA